MVNNRRTFNLQPGHHERRLIHSLQVLGGELSISKGVQKEFIPASLHFHVEYRILPIYKQVAVLRSKQGI